MNISRKENMKKICGFLYKYRHAWLLSYAFIYLPWFMFLERTVTRDYHIMHASLDDLIPFNEYFIVPYFLWFVYVAGTLIFFLFRSKEDYYKMCAFLFSGMTLSLVICTFFHNGTDFRPVIDPNKNIFSAAVAALYKTDTNTNVFPSIHVYNSVGTHIAISRSQFLSKHKIIKLCSFLLTASICLATMFLKQHSIIDVCGAFLMAYAIHYLVYGYATDTEDKKITEKALG